MDILGIGIPEIGFIILIALVILGPKDMQKVGKTIGRFMRKVVMSPEWRTVKDVSRQVKTLPNEWMREANQEMQELGKSLDIESDINDAISGKPALSSSGRPEFVVPKQNPAKKAEEAKAEVAENIEEKASVEGQNG